MTPPAKVIIQTARVVFAATGGIEHTTSRSPRVREGTTDRCGVLWGNATMPAYPHGRAFDRALRFS
jgi:hypothetical protein